jgi:hypothetical protein
MSFFNNIKLTRKKLFFLTSVPVFAVTFGLFQNFTVSENRNISTYTYNCDTFKNRVLSNTITNNLKISSFLDTNSLKKEFEPQTEAIQCAVDILVSSERFAGLDLEGMRIVVDNTIFVRNLKPNSDGNILFPKTISNGTIRAQYDMEETSDYLLDFSYSSKVHGFRLSNIELSLSHKMNGIKLSGNYVGFYLDNVTMRNPFQIGVSDQYEKGTKQGHELSISNSNFRIHLEGAASQQVVCVVSDSPDIKIRDSEFAYCKTSIKLTNGAYLINGNHFYQSDPKKNNNDLSPCIELTNGYGPAVITSNYIDHCFIKLSNETNGSLQIANKVINNNYFLVNTSNPDFAFVSVAPFASKTKVRNITIKNNTMYNSTLRPNTVNLISSDESAGGELLLGHIEGLFVSENQFNNVRKVENPQMFQTTTSVSSTQHTLSGNSDFPLSCKVKNVLSIVPVGLSTPTSLNVTRVDSATNTITVTTDKRVTGKIQAMGTCNHDM